MPIGIFDSGLGGLSVLQAAQRALPDAGFVYFGDNAHAPYGTRAPEDIRVRTEQALNALWTRCDLVILACNTASAIALRDIQTAGVPAGKRVLGVFVPMIEALAGRDWGDRSPPTQAPVERVALFATPATVASQAFERELALRAHGASVTAQACTGLVDAIEEDNAALVTELVHFHVTQLLSKQPAPQAAVLGCTHYPLVQRVFAEALGPNVTIISQPDLIAASLSDYLNRHPELNPLGEGAFITSGIPDVVSAQASRFMNTPITFEGHA